MNDFLGKYRPDLKADGATSIKLIHNESGKVISGVLKGLGRWLTIDGDIQLGTLDALYEAGWEVKDPYTLIEVSDAAIAEFKAASDEFDGIMNGAPTDDEQESAFEAWESAQERFLAIITTAIEEV